MSVENLATLRALKKRFYAAVLAAEANEALSTVLEDVLWGDLWSFETWRKLTAMQIQDLYDELNLLLRRAGRADLEINISDEEMSRLP